MANNLRRIQRRTDPNRNYDKISIHLNGKQIESRYFKHINKPFSTISVAKIEAIPQTDKFYYRFE
jgi:hypothetical protein